MVWTAPMTFVSNTVLTAAQLNTFLRDNMAETAPAKATTSGYHFVSTGIGAIAERPIAFDAVETAQTTASTTYTDLATPGPQLTLATGSRVIYMINAWQSNTIANNATYSAVTITGASSIGGDQSRAAITDGLGAAQGMRVSYFHMEEGLTPGSNTFTMQYHVTAGTGTFKWRRLIVICL